MSNIPPDYELHATRAFLISDYVINPAAVKNFACGANLQTSSGMIKSRLANGVSVLHSAITH